MKKIITFSILIAPFLTIYSQTVQPSNVIITPTEISGNADFKTTVKVDVNGDGVPEYSIVVNHQGYFQQPFNPVLISSVPVGGGATVYPDIDVWAEDSSTPPIQSNHSVEKPLEPAGLLAALLAGTKTLPNALAPSVPASIINPRLNEKQPASSTYFYKARIATSNFAIPVARFNMARNESNGNKIGDVTLFNSIGAGIGVSWGELELVTNDKSEVISREFSNNFGLNLGVLFSAGSGSEPKNIFAPTFTMSMLDIQFGVGYELGSLVDNQSRFFFTVAYAIPLSKLLKGKFYIYKASKGYNDKNPLQDDSNRADWENVHTFK